MAVIIPGNQNAAIDVASQKDENYDYPHDWDLKPGSTLHQDLLGKIMLRAHEAHQSISGRHAQWQEMDENLTAYITLDEKEKKIRENDPRKPVSLVIPMTYAIMETLLAQMFKAFIVDPIFKYEGGGPEDTMGAQLLERVVAQQMNRSQAGLTLRTQWRDGLAHGFGAVTPAWEVVHGKRTVRRPGGRFEKLTELFIPNPNKDRKKTIDAILYEGSRLDNIETYGYLPDPNVPVDRPQQGEFVAWIVRGNRMSIMRDEADSDGDSFNGRYLKNLSDGRSHFGLAQGRSGKDARIDKFNRGASLNPFDRLFMFIDLIPSEWKLTKRETPEKWMFEVAADKVILQARPMNLNHNMFPVAVASPGNDGYSASPISRMEMLRGMQENLDWLFSSHIANVRKALNDMIVVDPSRVNMHDLANPGPGKLIRMRKAAWGIGRINDFIKQLDVRDVTQAHMSDASGMVEFMNRTSGANDPMQGNVRKTSERITAVEINADLTGALSRIEMDIRTTSIGSMHDLAVMIASHTQQFMTQRTYVRAIGELEDQLLEEYGQTQIEVSPLDILVGYDAIPLDASVGSSQNVDTWRGLFDTISNSNILMQTFDVARVFKHTARLMGAKDLNEFLLQGGNFAAQLASQEQISEQLQAGNIVPVNEAAT